VAVIKRRSGEIQNGGKWSYHLKKENGLSVHNLILAGQKVIQEQ
jgi:hypothetical protein